MAPGRKGEKDGRSCRPHYRESGTRCPGAPACAMPNPADVDVGIDASAQWTRLWGPVRPAMTFPMCNGEPEMLPNGVKEVSRVSACSALFDRGAMVAGRQKKEQGTVSRSSVGYDIAGTGDLGLLVRHRNTGRVEAAW